MCIKLMEDLDEEGKKKVALLNRWIYLEKTRPQSQEWPLVPHVLRCAL